MGRKPYVQEMTEEERMEHCKVRRSTWDSKNEASLWKYKKDNVIRQCERRMGLPSRQTVIKYKMTRNDILHLFNLLVSDDHAKRDVENNL